MDLKRITFVADAGVVGGLPRRMRLFQASSVDPAYMAWAARTTRTVPERLAAMRGCHHWQQ